MNQTHTTNAKIEKIRQLMKINKIDAVIIPSDDPHQSEYVAEHWQARKWLTGFSGSAGTALLTLDRAVLWTDFRYYIQAETQIKTSEFELFKMGESDVLSVDKWLVKNLEKDSVVGIDGSLFSMESVKKYQKAFEDKDIEMNLEMDFIAQVWEDRPPMPGSKAFLFSDTYTGQSRADKIEIIQAKMADLGVDYYLMSSLDDIAWTLNLRGSDVHTNPVNVGFFLLDRKGGSLFINDQKMDRDIINTLNTDQIPIFEYTAVAHALSEIPGETKILADPQTTSAGLARAINPDCKIIQKTGPVQALKAIKNQTQISHMKETAVKDGVVMTHFLYWLERQSSCRNLTEMSVADRLLEFRKEQSDFVDNSFDPIMAYGPHSAMCHYNASKESDVQIGSEGMFLTDSGGNYLTGTTDITRTISRAKPSPQEINDYTLVLKGHISVATIVFPKGTRGVQIDTLARQYLWRQGMDFGHGTGHGVGYFLCVHEGPARISPQPVDQALKPGMLLTNEPGIYREGQYGIRLENMILVQEAFENEFGAFLKFDQMTLCPFELDLIDTNLLLEPEKEWLNTYHKNVYDKISPLLDKETAFWLKEKTRPV